MHFNEIYSRNVKKENLYGQTWKKMCQMITHVEAAGSDSFDEIFVRSI